jgi:hypothetical protein
MWTQAYGYQKKKKREKKKKISNLEPGHRILRKRVFKFDDKKLRMLVAVSMKEGGNTIIQVAVVSLLRILRERWRESNHSRERGKFLLVLGGSRSSPSSFSVHSSCILLPTG